MKAFLYRVCAIFFSHFVLYPDYRISFFIPLAFRFADYMTAQNKNIIYLFDPADIRAGDTGFAPYLVTLGFEKSPQSIAFVGDRLFVTLRVDDKRSELWEISPKNGKLLQDFTDSMVYPEKIAGARHTLLVVDRATQTVKAIGL